MEALHRPPFLVQVNKESLLESAQLATARLQSDRELLSDRAQLILAVLDLPVLRSLGDIIPSELAGAPEYTCGSEEVANLRQVFSRLAVGDVPPEITSFCEQLKRRKILHGKYWAEVKQEFERNTAHLDVTPETWPAFKLQMWNEKGLTAIGTRVPPNGSFAFVDAANAVLQNPGRFPYAEAHIQVVLYHVWRVIDQRRSPLEPNVHDLDLVTYMAGLDLLVCGEPALGGVIRDVFGVSKGTEDPLDFAEEVASTW